MSQHAGSPQLVSLFINKPLHPKLGICDSTTSRPLHSCTYWTHRRSRTIFEGWHRINVQNAPKVIYTDLREVWCSSRFRQSSPVLQVNMIDIRGCIHTALVVMLHWSVLWSQSWYMLKCCNFWKRCIYQTIGPLCLESRWFRIFSNMTRPWVKNAALWYALHQLEVYHGIDILTGKVSILERKPENRLPHSMKAANRKLPKSDVGR